MRSSGADAASAGNAAGPAMRERGSAAIAARSIERALLRLASPQAVLAPLRQGGAYGVFPQGDRRRRPLARLGAEAVRELVAEGAVEAAGDGFVLSAAGLARVRRDRAQADEAYLAQHTALGERAIIDSDGDVRHVRGVTPSDVIRRLAALRDSAGAPWLSVSEVAAAERLRTHWEMGQAGLTRGSDWTAPPKGAAARGPANAREAALAARCDARRRVEEALDALAAPLRRVVERVCLHEEGLEALERAQGWPARSGKLALKLGLAQLAIGVLSR